MNAIRCLSESGGAARRGRGTQVPCLIAFLAAALAPPAWGHEFWLEPELLRAQVNEEVSIRFFVGERFAGEERPYLAQRAREFRHLWAAGEERLPGEEGIAPAGRFRAVAPGLHVVAYRSAPLPIVLEPERFNAYLLDDGLYSPLETRRRTGQLDKPGRERYSRYCKTIVRVGEPVPGDSIAQRVLGHRLEIVLLSNPFAWSPGSELLARVLFEDQPLAGGVVFAACRDEPTGTLSHVLTDVEGRCRFTLDRPGLWMLSLVHMVPCEGCDDAEWESSWATLIVELGD